MSIEVMATGVGAPGTLHPAIEHHPAALYCEGSYQPAEFVPAEEGFGRDDAHYRCAACGRHRHLQLRMWTTQPIALPHYALGTRSRLVRGH